MALQETSSRTQNLTYAEAVISDIAGVSIPSYSEVPFHVFRDLKPLQYEGSDGSSTEFAKPTQASIDHYYEQLMDRGINAVVWQQVNSILQEAPVIIRCAPVVDSAHLDLSFAGTYPSFVPKPFPQDQHSIDIAVASVLAGKYTRYANYYHHRHDIQDRRLGVLAMALVTGPAIHGTVYSLDHNVRSEHVFDPSLGEEQFGAYHFVRDRFGNTGSVESDEFCLSINFPERLTDLTRTLEDSFGHAIDMEYLVDREGVIHVVQIRDMSAVHKSNWRKYYSQSQDDIEATPEVERRAIISSVGMFSGRIINYTPEAHPSLSPATIQLLEHGYAAEYLEKLDKLSVKSLGKLIILHGKERIRDHLQYATLEDPSISDLAHADSTDGISEDTREVKAYSNGDGFIHLL